MRLLVIDDDAGERQHVKMLANGFGYDVSEAGNGVEALKVLSSEAISVMITDLRMPQMDGLELIRQLKAEGTLPPTLVLTAYGSMELAVATVHELGVFWFLEKPVDAQSLKLLVERASTHGRLQSEVHELRRELTMRGALGDMVGQSSVMRNIFAMLRQVAPTTAPVLITGESGTGKELVARAIHSLSKRSGEPFVAVNCAALPETLIESELFGHEKGSFTGAVERRIGCIEMAECGTLFLDEIAEMPVDTGGLAASRSSRPMCAFLRLPIAIHRKRSRKANCGRICFTGWASSISSYRLCANGWKIFRSWPRR
jgi:DNA-binding NtrC family response regulator